MTLPIRDVIDVLAAGARRPAVSAMFALDAPINLNHPGHYVHWGVIQISVANLVVILVMIGLFVLALLLPFPKGRGRR